MFQQRPGNPKLTGASGSGGRNPLNMPNYDLFFLYMIIPIFHSPKAPASKSFGAHELESELLVTL